MKTTTTTKSAKDISNHLDTFCKLSEEAAQIARVFALQSLSVPDFRRLRDDFLERFDRFHNELIDIETNRRSSHKDVGLLLDQCEGLQCEVAHLSSYAANPPLRSSCHPLSIAV